MMGLALKKEISIIAVTSLDYIYLLCVFNY